MFRILGLHQEKCVLCGKTKSCFTATCEKGTFEAKPVCSRCLERQIELRQPGDGNEVAALSETKNPITSGEKP